jgi:hypothetical protein
MYLLNIYLLNIYFHTEEGDTELHAATARTEEGSTAKRSPGRQTATAHHCSIKMSLLSCIKENVGSALP